MRAAAAAFLLLAGCATLSAPGRELSAAHGLYSAGKYSGAAAAYRKIIQAYPGTNAAADARFSLAETLAAADNPQRNYGLALRELEEFLKLHPRHPKARRARDWRQVLRTLDQLNRSIEELKKLDVRHEEKRKRQ